MRFGDVRVVRRFEEDGVADAVNSLGAIVMCRTILTWIFWFASGYPLRSASKARGQLLD